MADKWNTKFQEDLSEYMGVINSKVRGMKSNPREEKIIRDSD